MDLRRIRNASQYCEEEQEEQKEKETMKPETYFERESREWKYVLELERGRERKRLQEREFERFRSIRQALIAELRVGKCYITLALSAKLQGCGVVVSIVWDYYFASEASFTTVSLEYFNKVNEYGSGSSSKTLELFDKVVDEMGYSIPKAVYDKLGGAPFLQEVSGMKMGWFFNQLCYRVYFASSDEELGNLARAITYEGWVRQQGEESIGCPFCGFGNESGKPETIKFSTKKLKLTRIWFICSYLLAINHHSGNTVARVFIRALVEQFGLSKIVATPIKRTCNLTKKAYRATMWWKQSSFDYECNAHLCSHKPRCGQ
jgi:hypothetical protein